MEEIQGGHCPCSKIQGGQPTTLPPPCRAPASDSAIDASRLCRTVTLMFRVYFSVSWLISNVSKFIINNTTENNTLINQQQSITCYCSVNQDIEYCIVYTLMRNPLSNIHTSSVYISWIRHLTISSSDVLICFITCSIMT